MTWREDRDALIAQTMAFVQSVTGKPADFAQFALPAASPAVGADKTGPTEPSDAVSAAPPDPVDAQQAANSAPKPVRDARSDPSPSSTSDSGSHDPGRPGPASSVQGSPDTGKTGTFQATAQPDSVEPSRPAPPRSGAFGAEAFTSIAGQFDLQRDMQTEIRSRVASFRAHQERFHRERQAYFSATLARLRASIDESTPSDNNK
jgi:hypothetical protein